MEEVVQAPDAIDLDSLELPRPPGEPREPGAFTLRVPVVPGPETEERSVEEWLAGISQSLAEITRLLTDVLVELRKRGAP